MRMDNSLRVKLTEKYKKSDLIEKKLLILQVRLNYIICVCLPTSGEIQSVASDIISHSRVC